LPNPKAALPGGARCNAQIEGIAAPQALRANRG
jgi:hypothetical protein